MDRSAGAAKRGPNLVPCKYNNIITVGLVPGARRKRNFNIRFTRNTQGNSFVVYKTNVLLAATDVAVDVIFMTLLPNGY